MNTTTANVALFTLAAGSLSAATEQLVNNHLIAGGILAVIGIALVIIYEKFPSSPAT